MKFYGVEIGCNKVFTAGPDEEVITVTSFGGYESELLSRKMFHVYKDTHLEITGILPKESQNVVKLPGNLRDAKNMYPYCEIHFLLSKIGARTFKNLLHEVFPASDYIII